MPNIYREPMLQYLRILLLNRGRAVIYKSLIQYLGKNPKIDTDRSQVPKKTIFDVKFVI